MRVLILGLGFIATHIAEILSKEHEIIVTYRTLNPVKEVYYNVLSSNGVKLVRMDPLLDKELLKDLVKNSDAIVNCIGEISGNEEKLKIANYEIPKLLSLTIKFSENKPMLIHLSASTYGITGKVAIERPIGVGLRPRTPFEYTKLEGEKVIYSIAKEGNFPIIILRPTLVYGKYAAHIQFVTLYKLIKRRIFPSIPFKFQPVSANHIALMIRRLLIDRPKELYFYATECELIKLDKILELYSKALRINSYLKIPIPKKLAILGLPREVRNLVKYEGTEFDCSVAKELISNLSFDEDEVIKNALFLRELDQRGKLIPT